MNEFFKVAGVELKGSALDEARMAYKNIYELMKHQKDPGEVLGCS